MAVEPQESAHERSRTSDPSRICVPPQAHYYRA
jgi:hypothetical protein